MATRSAVFCLLDYHGDPFGQLDQHERGNSASVRTADRARSHSRKCGTMLVHTGRIEPAWQNSGGWLLDRFFGPHVAFGRNLITALGIFLLAHAYSFPSGCLAAALIGIGADGDSATTPYPAGALFWSVRIFLPSMASVGLSTPLQELSDLSFWGRRSM